MKILMSILISMFASPPTDSVIIDTVAITANIKTSLPLNEQALSASEFRFKEIEQRNFQSLQDISSTVPNFYQPHYGSRMTSSVYVRGFGSRIDQPSLSIIVDNIPIMNKNAFDFDFFDIKKIELLRGPQGTLYGRNSSGGVMNIFTLSPFNWQGLRMHAEISSEMMYKAKISYYNQASEHFAYSIATNISHNDGFFQNEFTGKNCDWGNNAAARLKFHWKPKPKWNIENSTSLNYTQEGGYAYRFFDETNSELHAVNYNDSCNYSRLLFSEGLVIKHHGQKADVSLVTSYQYLNDELNLDNDFTNLSYFTLNQKQREHDITQEIIFKRNNKDKRWQWTSGLFAFFKNQQISSPVVFKRDGIEKLILANANKGIHTVFPSNEIEIEDLSFPIFCNFDIPTLGVAAYHESNWTILRWKFTAGLRIDAEWSAMNYNETSDFSYRFNLTMPKFRTLHSEFIGRESQQSFVMLPKISVQRLVNCGNIYATIAYGHKAGGYNTQIFSDIMQGIIMNNLMNDLGVSLVSMQEQTKANATKYRPETNINFEIGSHLKFNKLQCNISAFWIESRNQQVTVLPKGNGIGRMMSNAAKARSIGVEYSMNYTIKNATFSADYGFTDARFKEFQYSDSVNYTNNHLPYAPQNTITLAATYKLQVDKKFLDAIVFRIQYQGIGKIYWNDENTLSQPLYSTFAGNISFQKGNLSVNIFGKNLTNTHYNTFYFRSISRSFFSEGSPRIIGINCNLNI